MAIFTDNEHRIFYLHSAGCTYAFGINGLGVPEHLYFGAPVGNDLYLGTYNDQGRIHPALRRDADGNSYDLSAIPQELHTPYGGDYYAPSLVLQYANGSRRSDLTYTGYEVFTEKPPLAGLPAIRQGQTLAVYLTSKDVKVTLFYTVSENTTKESNAIFVYFCTRLSAFSKP